MPVKRAKGKVGKERGLTSRRRRGKNKDEIEERRLIFCHLKEDYY